MTGTVATTTTVTAVATTSPPGKGGKQILGMDPLLFWGLVGAFGLGAAYFLFIRKPSANPAGSQAAPGTGSASGPWIIAAEGAPMI